MLFYHPSQNNLFLLPENMTGCSIGLSECLWNDGLLLAAALLYKEPQWQIQSDQLRADEDAGSLDHAGNDFWAALLL